MRVLIVGSGGREHALAWKLKQSPLVDELYIAPGNGGTGLEGVNVDIKDDDIPALVQFAKDKEIDLVVAGPELPLVLGISDALANESIACFGPNGFAAQLEGSKAFAKTVMQETGVPTADFKVFEDYAEAKAHVMERSAPMVVKADGLAAGKGVVVAKTQEEALEALDSIMQDKAFGKAGNHVVVEDALVGEEASFLAFCDGENIALMPSAQDHKAVGEGDTGPNTGGMGAYSPAPILPEERYEELANLVIKPIVDFMSERGAPFVGILYAGLMMTADGPMVLEYNVRFGDPECQPLLMRLKTDLAKVMVACVTGELDKLKVEYTDETTLCVVMASGGYPGPYKTGFPISGLDAANAVDKVTVFHAGTKTGENGEILTSGGRVLGVTALGSSLADAQANAYKGVDEISFEGSYIRRDIGSKGLK